MPAVIIRDHRHRRVRQLGLAREFRLGHIGHADDIALPTLTINPALGLGGELRAFNRDIGQRPVALGTMNCRACRSSGSLPGEAG